MINIEDSDPNLLKIDKDSNQKINICFIGYLTMKIISGYKNINSVNPLYFIVYKVDGYIEEINGNKYLVFASTDENEEVVSKYTELWDGIKNLNKAINSGKEGEHKKYFIKTKFNSDDYLPLNKLFKLLILTSVVKSVFEEDYLYYRHDFLDQCFYEL